MAVASQNLWSIPVALAEIPDEGLQRSITAEPIQREAIAAAAGLRELPSLTATFELHRTSQDEIVVHGHVSATVGQTCVITLEPIDNVVREDVDLIFAPQNATSPPRRAMSQEDGEGAEPPEPLVGDSIDLGRIAVEFLMLGLDPYPRKPGAVFEPVLMPADPADHPFAGLAALKPGKSAPETSKTSPGGKKPR